MIAAIILLTLLAAVTGYGLGRMAAHSGSNSGELTEKINQLLPQTQCGQCEYPGCRPYAQAIAEGHAPINQCPPGGETTIKALAALLGRDVIPLDAAFGETKPLQVAIVRESECIGCTLCIHACPVDAILGSSRMMHTVISSECTGCELCLPPCPVDCIDLSLIHI